MKRFVVVAMIACFLFCGCATGVQVKDKTGEIAKGTGEAIKGGIKKVGGVFGWFPFPW